MKIDFVIGGLKAGGAEKVVSILAYHFSEKNILLELLTLIIPMPINYIQQ